MKLLQTVIKCARAYALPIVRTNATVGAAEKLKPNSDTLVARVKAFAEKEGRQPRIFIAKMGKEGSNSETMQFAAEFAYFGFDVDVGPYLQTPEDVARHAVDEDVHAIGIQNLVVNHFVLIPTLMRELERFGRVDIPVIITCDIPHKDHEKLYKIGVAAIFYAKLDIIEQASKTLDRIEAAFPPIKPRQVRNA